MSGLAIAGSGDADDANAYIDVLAALETQCVATCWS
jgi:hypothetical protein